MRLGSPLEQFEVINILNLSTSGGTDVSLTNVVFLFLLFVGLTY
jgi:hypothetical protein